MPCGSTCRRGRGVEGGGEKGRGTLVVHVLRRRKGTVPWHTWPEQIHAGGGRKYAPLRRPRLSRLGMQRRAEDCGDVCSVPELAAGECRRVQA